MEDNLITRVDDPHATGQKKTFTTHYYPFETLPIIKSHLHPKFAIVNAGQKIQKLGTTNGKIFGRVVTDYPILGDLMRVYMAWLQPADLDDKSFNVPFVPPLELIGGNSRSDDGHNDNDDDSDYDNRTIPCRPRPRNRMTPQHSLQGSPVRKQKCREPAPRASGSKRKVLSELSLSKLHHQIGARPWTGHLIREWDQENWPRLTSYPDW